MKVMFKIIPTVCIVFLGLIMPAVFSQTTQNIRGTVADIDSKAPLIGANVLVVGSDPVLGASTDVNGNFSIKNVPIGRHTLQISYIGYNSKTLSNIELSSGKELILNITLQQTVEMKEVTVTAEKEKEKSINKMATVSARTLSVEESMRYAGTLNDVARMAQNFAGVQGANDSRNDIIIRGNSPTGVLYRMEDIDIPNPNHFALNGTTGGPISIINNNALDNSDFMTGAFPAEYGNALAGVFDLKLRNGNNQNHEFLGQIGFNGAEFMAEGPINKEKFSSYLVSYRYSTLKVFQLMGVNFGTGTTVPDYQDAVFKINLPNKKGQTTFWGIGGISAVKFLDSEYQEDNLFAESGQDVIFKSNIGAGGVSNIYRFNEKSFLKTSLSIDATVNKISTDTLNRFNGQFFPQYRNNSVEGKQTLNLVYQNKLNVRNTLKIGLYNQRRFFSLYDSVHRRADTVFIPILNLTAIYPDYWYKITQTEGATYFIQPFVQWQHRLNENITINGGVHGQVFMLNKTYAVEPRLGVKWQLNKKTSLNTAYGLHNQLVPSRLYFRQLTDQFGNVVLNAEGEPFIPNRELEMIRSHHFVLGVDRSLGKNSRLKLETYYQSIDNVPVQNFPSYYSTLNYGANFALAFPDTLVNSGTGYNYGLELTIEQFLNKGFYYLFTTSLYQSTYKGSDGVERNTAFNGNYTFNLLTGKEFVIKTKKNKATNLLVVDFKSSLNGGQRFIPIDLEASKQAGQAVYDFNEVYVDKFSDYFRIDLKIGYKRNGKKITQEWSMNLANITNHKNVFQQVYNASSQQVETRYQTGFLPIAQYKILF
jgi:hypothetical protein